MPVWALSDNVTKIRRYHGTSKKTLDDRRVAEKTRRDEEWAVVDAEREEEEAHLLRQFDEFP